jgi:nicotinate-nucleotide pyrophosphorylase (carboxylating)
MIAPLPDLLIAETVRAALAEDLGRAGDITSLACVPADTRLRAVFAARQAGVVAGLACARLAVLALDPTADFKAVVEDGDRIGPGDKLAWVDANARALLGAGGWR